MMMSISTDDLLKIVEAGGGLTLDAGTKTKDELVGIATAAGHFEVLLALRNVIGLALDDLVEIAKAGDGMVTFEL
jgi:hypothetical protein